MATRDHFSTFILHLHQLHACRRAAFTDWVWLVVYWEWLGAAAEDCLALLENLPQDMINMLMKWQ